MAKIASLAGLRPGDIALGPIRGLTGLGVGLGQLALGEGFRVGTLSIRHARIVTQAQTWEPMEGHAPGQILGPNAVEAMPSGARKIGLHGGNAWDDSWAYFRLTEDYPGQGEDAARIAEAMIGTPYSPLSYLALALWRFGVRTPRLERWIDRRRPFTPWPGAEPGPDLCLPREAICSVLVDQAWTLAGKRVMEGVARQAVTPGALARRLLVMTFRDEASMTVPGWS